MPSSVLVRAAHCLVAALGLVLVITPAAVHATGAPSARVLADAPQSKLIPLCPACWDAVPSGS